MSTSSPARTAGRSVASVAALAAAFALGGAFAAPAMAAPAQVQDVTLAWSVNDESGGGAFFGGCNFLVAGEAGDTGSSRVWTEADGFYSASQGNVSIRKPNADGGWDTPTWQTKCRGANGSAVTTARGSTTGNEVVFSQGTGTLDTATGTAEVSWDGAFTFVYYGGMTYWSVSDPVLSIDADGTGTLSGTASGYGADMNDPSKWVELEPTEIELANLRGVELSEEGFSVTPDYLEVPVEVQPDGPSGPQQRTGEHWGAFPQSLVDFNLATGQAAYWYSSGGAVDPKKPVNPLSVSWDAGDVDAGPVDPQPEPGEDEVIVDVELPEGEDSGPVDPGNPGEFSWVIEGNNANLGRATLNEGGTFSATGALPTVTVTDTRESAASWSLTAQASDFAGGSESFAASALGWAPSISSNTVGAVAGPGVQPGDGGLGTSRVLVEAANGHQPGSVQASAALNLLAPAGTPAGSYSSTVTLTAIG